MQNLGDYDQFVQFVAILNSIVNWYIRSRIPTKTEHLALGFEFRGESNPQIFGWEKSFAIRKLQPGRRGILFS